jgi:hypothetical protein
MRRAPPLFATLKSDAGKVLAHLLRMQITPYSQRVAVRAFVTVLSALLFLWHVGHLELSAHAMFGALASVGGGGFATRERNCRPRSARFSCSPFA